MTAAPKPSDFDLREALCVRKTQSCLAAGGHGAEPGSGADPREL